MKKNSRAYKIYEAAENDFPGNTQLLQSVARMLDYATRPKKSAKTAKPALGFGVGDLLASCTVDPDNVPSSMFGRIGKLAKDLGVKPTDIEALDRYMTAKGRRWYDENDVTITAQTVTKNLARWLEEARNFSGSATQLEIGANFR